MNLVQFLTRRGVSFEMVPKSHTVHTTDAAEAAGVSLGELTKSLVCLGPSGEAYVAVIAGDRKLDLKALARALGMKKLRLCPYAEAHRYSGYPPGATPPVHHRKIAGLVVDRPLTALTWLYGGGGTNEVLVKMRPADVVRLGEALVADISSDGD